MKRCSKLLAICGICLLFLVQNSQQTYAHPLLIQQTSPYSVLGAPTISAAFIDQVLAANHSPAAGKGQALFADGVTYGIDPVYALAFFMHESSFGTTGVARTHLSLGNLRCIPGYPCYEGFTAFPTWEAGFVSWYVLIRDVYVDTWHLSTIEQIVPTYAPASDHNDVSAYINAVERAVDAWRSGQVANFGPVSQVAALLPVANSSRTPYAADQYSILGQPTIDGTFINRILTQYHSPAAGKGLLFYEEGVKYGIDPVYALAFFMRDSIFGKQGLALATHALGPLPSPVTLTCHCQDFQGYRRYATWDDGIADWFQYMHDDYVKQRGLTTVSQIVSIYLKTNDTTAINLAIKQIEGRVDLWRNQQMHTPST